MRPEEYAAIARGLAGLSHDLKNVLAILGESVGLIDDLLQVGGGSTTDGRVTTAFDRVARQLDRANDMISKLNRFAHSFDDASASLPVGDLVEHAVFLVERRARSRDVTIERELSPALAGSLAVPGAVRPALGLALVLEAGLSALPPGARLRIGSDGDWVTLSSDTPVGDRPAVSPAVLADTGCFLREPDRARGEIFAIRLS
jgi:signal transduction histidine kinase